ncbi:hypothetical protein GW916_10640 [bacterium]|nr:hypothetical protein [bacterium]
MTKRTFTSKALIALFIASPVVVFASVKKELTLKSVEPKPTEHLSLPFGAQIYIEVSEKGKVVTQHLSDAASLKRLSESNSCVKKVLALKDSKRFRSLSKKYMDVLGDKITKEALNQPGRKELKPNMEFSIGLRPTKKPDEFELIRADVSAQYTLRQKGLGFSTYQDGDPEVTQSCETDKILDYLSAKISDVEKEIPKESLAQKLINRILK